MLVLFEFDDEERLCKSSAGRVREDGGAEEGWAMGRRAFEASESRPGELEEASSCTRLSARTPN